MNTNNFYTVDEQIYNSTKKQSEINKLIHKIKKGYCNIYLIRKSKNPDVMFVSSMKLAIKKYTKRIAIKYKGIQMVMCSEWNRL